MSKFEEAEKLFATIKEYDLSAQSKIKLYLSSLSSCLNSAYSNKNLWESDKRRYEKNIEDCSYSTELKILEALQKDKIIDYNTYSQNAGANIYASIKIADPEKLTFITKWSTQKQDILNYGIFSLNYRNGIAFCDYHPYSFDTSSGYYHLFKSFLLKHRLEFKEGSCND